MSGEDTVDFNHIVDLSKRARESKYQCHNRIYTLRTPTDHEMQVIYLRHDGDAASRVLIARAAVELAIVGWTGVTLADLLDGQPPAEVPYRKDLVPVLLDRHDDDYATLMKVVFDAFGRKRTELENDVKN